MEPRFQLRFLQLQSTHVKSLTVKNDQKQNNVVWPLGIFLALPLSQLWLSFPVGLVTLKRGGSKGQSSQGTKQKWSCSVMSNCLCPVDCSLPGSLRPWNFLGKSTGVGCHFLLQRIFPTQGSNPGLSHIAGRHFTIWATWEAFQGTEMTGNRVEPVKPVTMIL